MSNSLWLHGLLGPSACSNREKDGKERLLPNPGVTCKCKPVHPGNTAFIKQETTMVISPEVMVHSESCSVVSDPLPPKGLYSPQNSPGQNTGVGSLSLLQGISPTQGSNPGPLHCRQILYQLGHNGSPRKLEWVAYHFSSTSFWPRNWTGAFCIAGGFLP